MRKNRGDTVLKMIIESSLIMIVSLLYVQVSRELTFCSAIYIFIAFVPQVAEGAQNIHKMLPNEFQLIQLYQQIQARTGCIKKESRCWCKNLFRFFTTTNFRDWDFSADCQRAFSKRIFRFGLFNFWGTGRDQNLALNNSTFVEKLSFTLSLLLNFTWKMLLFQFSEPYLFSLVERHFTTL